MRDRLKETLTKHQAEFGIELTSLVLDRLADHFELVMEHNPLLHLTAPMSADEFAVRHVLESLTILEFLPNGSTFADVGSGAGFPAVPCLIVRNDLRGVMIESKAKKADFLRSVISRCDLSGRAEVIAKQFSEVPRPDATHVSCRALDRFTQHLPKLLKWSGDRTLLFFGGPALGDEMRRLGLHIEAKLMPLSEQRFLFIRDRC